MLMAIALFSPGRYQLEMAARRISFEARKRRWRSWHDLSDNRALIVQANRKRLDCSWHIDRLTTQLGR